MQRHIVPRKAPDITAEACAWIAQLETGELTAADREAFGEWVGRSPRHAAEIRRLARLSLDLNVLTDMAEPLREAARQQREVTAPAKRKTRFGAARLAACAALVLAVAATALLLSPWYRPIGEPMVAATALGEHREIALADGTLVTLNTDSRLEVAYDRRERKVRLLRGEAYFEVAKSRRWPFVVYAGDNTVRAVGTAFAVSLLNQQTHVTVTEGRVELAEVNALPDDATTRHDGQDAHRDTSRDSYLENKRARPAAPFKPIALAAGQSVTVTPTASLEPVVTTHSRRELERELAWRDGLLEFSDTPLADVVAQINRYSKLTVEITDPALAELKFGGIFRIGDTGPLLDALRTSYHITVRRLDGDRIVLSRAAAEDGKTMHKTAG
ncbi:MAG: FecR domain-containing protein [Halioglobus sp.]|nr:FecR domain-containing protein [Halioglobus sp.]